MRLNTVLVLLVLSEIPMSAVKMHVKADGASMELLDYLDGNANNNEVSMTDVQDDGGTTMPSTVEDSASTDCESPPCGYAETVLLPVSHGEWEPEHFLENENEGGDEGDFDESLSSIAQLRRSDRKDCLEALFVQANLKESEIPRYVQEFRNNNLDVEALLDLSFIDLVTFFQRNKLGFKGAGDIFNLYKCISNRGPCVSQPFCRNGGSCVHAGIIRQHVCRCPDNFQGDQCQEKVLDRVGKVETAVKSIQQQVASSGAVYTRWAKSTCNEAVGATLIYAGVMGGSHYTHTGGSANYLCLPSDPVYDKFRSGAQSDGLVYSAELETAGYFSPFGGHNNHDPVCAVCQTGGGRLTTFLQPAKNSCPESWTLEYKGYLMAEKHDFKRTQYVCVDDNPEVTSGTGDNHDGVLLYFQEAACPAKMACPPYDRNKELTCAVCSR